MHPETMRALVNVKIADELAWAHRQRLARLARSEPSPDAVRFEAPVEHLSFASRLRSAIDAVIHAPGRPTALKAG